MPASRVSSVRGELPAPEPPMRSLYDDYPRYHAPPLPPQPLVPAQTQVPIPKPVTELSFPLDPTRTLLLGQVEYYFSTQNLAQDLYLRKQARSSLFANQRRC